MTNRRSHGEGSIYFDKTANRWVAAVTFYDSTGERRRSKRKARTKSEAREKLRALQRQIEDSLPTGKANMTVAELLGFFVDTVVTSADPSPNTLDNYHWAINKHLSPALGTKRVISLTAEDIERFLADRRKNHNLSKSSLSRLRSVLVAAIREAQRRDWVHRNVAELARVPASHTTKRRSLTMDEATALLSAAESHRFHAAILVGLTRGLRPGEILGLKWPDLELEREPCVMHVRRMLKREKNGLLFGEPKTPKSRRDLILPEPAVAALRQHRARQNEQRLASGNSWRDNELIFCTEIGTPIDPSNFRREFKKLTRAAGLGDRPPYELRHSAVSLLAAAGVPIDQLADLAGHTDATTLLQVYRHQVYPAVDAGAGIVSTMFERPAVQT